MSFSQGGTTISGAGDVVISSLSNNQVLTYDSSVAKWKNANPTNASIYFSVKTFGATGDGTTDDTTAITTAITAANTNGGGVVYFPAGTYITTQQKIYSNLLYLGDGPGASIIKLKAATNADLFISDQFNTLTGTTALGPSKFGFANLTLDGNRTAQTATALCARIYGYNYSVSNVWFNNGFRGGVYSEWGGSDSPNLMEAQWEQFKIWNYGGAPGSTGLEWNGPHDSAFSNGIIATLDSTLRATDVTYGATPVNGSTVTLPAASTSFTFVTTAAAATGSYPTSGGTFVVPIASGTYSWVAINYTSASTSGSVTTFSGCTSPQGAVNVTANGGIVVPSYGYRDRSPVEGTGHNGLGEVVNSVHVWGRNHFGIYVTTANYFSNCQAEGSFIANVVLDSSGSVWTGGTIYGTNGQTGQANETGLQIGQTYNGARNLIVTYIYNVGSGGSGSSIRMTRTAGNNILRVLGTTSANIFLSTPFYNQSGDWYEVICHNNQALTVLHTPYQSRLPLGLFLGNGTALPGAGGHIYAGAGAPSIASSIAGDYYFRTDTPSTPAQQLYVATGANTWTAVTGAGSSTLAGDTDVALSSPTDGQVLTYVASSSKWVNVTPSSSGSGTNTNTEETAVPLGANATFTGQSHAVITPVLATVAAESNQTYTVNIQQSTNNTTWTTTYTATPTLNSGIYSFSYSIPLRRYDYMRVVVANGSTAQTYLTVSSSLVG